MMFRFSGLDGLRGWLAWTVVIHHVVLYTGLSVRFPQLQFIHRLGDSAVSVFVILSGFVITHLILEKHEPYRFYIARRLLRIYPIYFVALIFGVVTTFLTFETFLASQQSLFIYPDVERLAKYHDALAGNGFIKQLIAHLTMLHGAIPSNVLFESQYMFLSPAWSLSLEWQFYLVAPLIIWAACRKWASVVVAIVASVLFHAYFRGKFGLFILPSFLPGALLLFAVGIVSRLMVGRNSPRGSWVAVIPLVAIFFYDSQSIGPIVFWIIFFGASLLKSKSSKAGHLIKVVFDPLFDSALAKHLGIPSYSTYLLHIPILEALMFVATRLEGDFTVLSANVFAGLGTIMVAYVASQLGYKFVELRAINFGKRFGRQVAKLQQA